MQVTASSSQSVLINAGYPAAQLQAAVAAAERAALSTAHRILNQGRCVVSADYPGLTAAREAAQAAAHRVRKWADVRYGMAAGVNTVGSREPVDDLPVWVTPGALQLIRRQRVRHCSHMRLRWRRRLVLKWIEVHWRRTT